MRRGALLIAALALLAGCTNGHSEAGLSRAADASGAHPAASVIAEKSTLDCGDAIDVTDAPPDGFQTVLGVVALPASPRHPALQTGLTGDDNPALRLFAKTGLVVKAGASFELMVPAQFTDHLSIGWAPAPTPPSHRVVVSGCTAGNGGWLAYPGGYWTDRPACLPIVVEKGAEQQQVFIGIGTPCAGQLPPPGPSEG